MKSTGPRSELYLRADIANVVRAIDAANAELSAALPLAEVAAYRAGFLAALRSLALAFDLDISPASAGGAPERLWNTPHYLTARILD